MGIFCKSACSLPGFLQTVLASMRVWFNTLPMPAKSWARSAKGGITKEVGKGCFKAFIKHYCHHREWEIIK